MCDILSTAITETLNELIRYCSYCKLEFHIPGFRFDVN